MSGDAAANREALEQVLETRGVRFAALLSGSGEVQAFAGADAGQAAALVVPARAIVQTLQTTLEADGWDDMMLEVEGGPVLLAPAAEGSTLAVGFDELSGLGRVRLALRRAQGKLVF